VPASLRASPPTISSLNQHALGTFISAGTKVNQTSFSAVFNITDPDTTDTKIPKLEIRPVGVSFTYVPNVIGSTKTYTGGTLITTITVTGLLSGTNYHWQGMVRDTAGSSSTWVSFGGNSESQADILIDTVAPAAIANLSVTSG